MNSSSYSAIGIDNDAHGIFDAPNPTGTPERNLLLAMLERAILDFVGNDQLEIESAEEWLFENEGELLRPFTFRWVCHQLDLDSDQVQSRIKSMPKRGNRKIAPWYFKASNN